MNNCLEKQISRGMAGVAGTAGMVCIVGMVDMEGYGNVRYVGLGLMLGSKTE